jgi:hypothetical protein
MPNTSDLLSDEEHNERIISILADGAIINKFDPSQIPEMLLSSCRIKEECVISKLYWMSKLIKAIRGAKLNQSAFTECKF